MTMNMINDIIASSIRIATPITLAALGGVFCQKAHVFNISLEGTMLVGAFVGICGVQLFGGNVWLGILCAMVAGILFSLLFSLCVNVFNANQIISGIGMNLLALGLTSFLLRSIFHTAGSLRPATIGVVPNIQIPFLKNIPIIGAIFTGQNLISYIGFAFIIIIAVLLYRTPFGMNILAIGELPEALQTAGISLNKVRRRAILWAGALSGLGGAYLSLISVSQFTEDMVQGRGFTAFSALIFANANPLFTFAVSVLFGFADAIGIRVELYNSGFPSSIVKMFPYILSIVALALSCYIREVKRKNAMNLNARKQSK